MKTIFSNFVFFLLSFLLWHGTTFSQCVSTVSGPTNVGCNSAQTFNGMAYSTATAFNFNGGAFPPGWTASAFIIGQPCALPSTDGTNYFWASAVAGPRFIYTSPVNTSAGGLVSFQIRFGNDDPDPGCENVDAGEGVELQYSIDGGTNYTTIQYFDPVAAAGGAIGFGWVSFNIPMPVGAWSPSTIFRWKQLTFTSASYDNWGLDNISISQVIPITNHAWNMGDGTVIASGSASQGHVYTTPGSYVVTYTATLQDGCVTTSTMNVNVAQNMVLNCPANISVNNDTGVCGARVCYGFPNATGVCAAYGAAIPGYTYLGAIGNNSYYISNASTDYNTALASCETNGGYLTQIGSGAENTQIRTWVDGLLGGVPYYIGYNDIDTEGTFVWEDCTAAGYTNFSAGEPNNWGGDEDATQVLGSGLWNDISTTTSAQRHILELNGAKITRTAGLAPNSVFPIGTTTVSYLATDVFGNTSTCSFNVTVTDNTAPAITCPANISVNNDAGVCGATVTYTTPVGTDNCSPTTTQTTGLASGSVFPVGTTTNTFSVSDASGNTTTCSFTVTVTDNTAPVITCPADIAVNNDAGVCGARVCYGFPNATDNCAPHTAAIPGYTYLGSIGSNSYYISTASTDYSAALASCVANGGYLTQIGGAAENTQIRNWVTTLAGGISYFIGYNDIDVEGTFVWEDCGSAGYTNWMAGEPNNSGNEDATQVLGTGLWNDIPAVGYNQRHILELNGARITQTAGLAPNSVFPIGTTTVSFLATDNSGNTSTCSFTITVTDNENPAITCPANISVNNDAGVCGATVTYTAPTGTDNCPGATTTQTAGLASGSVFPVGTTTNTFKVTDASGNFTTCSFDVVVTDNENPTITCPANISVNNDAGVCGATVTYTTPVGADNCTTTTTQTAGLASGSVFPIGTTTNTFSVSDASGNTTTCSFDVVVTDNELPSITCPANMSVISTIPATVTWTEPTPTDNCGIASSVSVPANGSVFPFGTTAVNYTVTDNNGNVSTCSFNVTVIAPIFPPSAPGYLIVEGIDTKTMKLRFPDPESNETGFELYRSTDGVNWVFHKLLPESINTVEIVHYDTVNTVADMPYYYVVRTVKNGKRSGFSNSAYDYTYPHAPSVSIITTACENGKGTMKATGTHVSNKYRWYLGENDTKAVLSTDGNYYDSDIFYTDYLTAAKTYYVTSKGKKYESKPRVAVTMPILARPAINIVGGLSQRACGSEITLAVEPVAGVTYSWSLNGVAIAGASEHTFTANQSGIYHVSLNNGSCSTASAQIYVVTNFKPKAIIRQGKRTSFCASGVISAKSETSVAYEWYKDDVLVGTGENLTVTESGIYVLKSIESGCENTAQIDVKVSTFPSNIEIAADNETLCQGSAVVLTTSEVAGTVYNWYRNGLYYATTYAPTLSVRRGGRYVAEVSYNTSCSKRSAEVIVNEVKRINLTKTFDGMNFTLNIPAGANVASATWTIDGEAAPSLNNLLTFKPTVAGTYEVTVLWDNGCESKMKTNVTLGTLGVDEEENESENLEFFVYPNPTKGRIFVDLGVSKATSVAVTLTDNLGRLMLSENKAGAERIELNIEKLPVGTYLLNIAYEGVSKTYKIVKD